MMNNSLSSTARSGDLALLESLEAHFGSAREFQASVRSQYEVMGRLSQWVEWVDVMLTRRFATSVMLVGTIALLIALMA
jgi:hypothetical protein